MLSRGRFVRAATTGAIAVAVSACAAGTPSTNSASGPTPTTSTVLHVGARVITSDMSVLATGLAQLRADGLRVDAPPGAVIVGLSGTAAQLDRALGVTLMTYGSGTGQYYAPTGAPHPDAAVAAALADFSGLSDQHPVQAPGGIHALADAPPATGGYNAADLTGMYDVNSVHQSGNLGQGQTIVLLEGGPMGSPSDITQFDTTNNLPPLTYTTRTDSADWGQPDNGDVETNLDVEIAHLVAPSATIVIYEASLAGDGLNIAAQAAITEHPGAVISESLGACELQQPNAQQLVSDEDTLAQAAAAAHDSWFVSSGDNGAFGCGGNGQGANPDFTDLSVNILADPAQITSVGGTSAFEGPNQSYGHEVAWGDPIEVGGSGGGVSTLEPRPSWQTGPGVDNQYSTGMRQQPDVAGLAGILTGINVVFQGRVIVIGGTSAAAPFWAGVAALANHQLSQQGLPPLGAVNPSLYYFGNHLSALPANPYHDITQGNNFGYPATSGWDYTTGWGTPDVANLLTDWVAYKKQGGQ